MIDEVLHITIIVTFICNLECYKYWDWNVKIWVSLPSNFKSLWYIHVGVTIVVSINVLNHNQHTCVDCDSKHQMTGSIDPKILV
jgi:hypothetical protein